MLTQVSANYQKAQFYVLLNAVIAACFGSQGKSVGQELRFSGSFVLATTFPLTIEEYAPGAFAELAVYPYILFQGCARWAVFTEHVTDKKTIPRAQFLPVDRYVKIPALY